jgi:hypothetical protein
VFDSCDVRFDSGTYVVASNHDGTAAAEAVVASVCADMMGQGANSIAKGAPLNGAHQVCYGGPQDGADILIASTYDDWETGTALCNSAPSMSQAKSVAASQAAERELDALRAQLDAQLAQLSSPDGWITYVDSPGRVVEVSDGSAWYVMPAHRYESVLWLPVDDVYELSTRYCSGTFGTTLVDFDQNTYVCAARLE